MSDEAQVKILFAFLLMLQVRLDGLPFQVDASDLIKAHTAKVWIV